MVNNNEITKALKKEKLGLSITDLVSKTSLSRGQIRTAISFLLGSGEIIERQTGMTKLYFLNTNGETSNYG